MPDVETCQLRDDAWLIVIRSEHDLATKPGLSDVIEQIDRTTRTALVIDLKAATFIDSTVVNIIVQAHKSGARVLVVAAEDGPVRRVLDLVGIDQLLPLFTSRDDAIAAL